MKIKDFINRAIAGGWKNYKELKHWNGEWVQIYTDKPCKIWDDVAKIERDSFVTVSLKLSEILLDPLFWKAVGKTDGWDGKTKTHTYTRYIHSGKPKLGKITVTRKNKGSSLNWKVKMHRLIDALAEASLQPGFDMQRTIEQFLETL